MNKDKILLYNLLKDNITFYKNKPQYIIELQTPPENLRYLMYDGYLSCSILMDFNILSDFVTDVKNLIQSELKQEKDEYNKTEVIKKIKYFKSKYVDIFKNNIHLSILFMEFKVISNRNIIKKIDESVIKIHKNNIDKILSSCEIKINKILNVDNLKIKNFMIKILNNNPIIIFGISK